jgi:uncharacterized protein YbjT (DUF2867 family)
MIAIMGAAGNVGGNVADQLLREDHDVRVLEHRRKLDGLAGRGAAVVTGDAVNPGDLRSLFDGADTALVLLPENLADREFAANRSRMSAAIADALAGARVGHVVVLSTVGAGLADAPGPPAGLRELEQRLSRLAGTNVLVLRSGFYMENLLAALPLIQSQNVNGSAIDGDLPIPMIATRDVAGEAAARLLRRDFTGHQVKLLLGPEDVTMRAATRAIGERLGLPDLPYVQFPPAGVRAALAGAGMSEEAASLMVDMQLAMNRGWPFASVRRTAEEATPTTLEAFLKETML